MIRKSTDVPQQFPARYWALKLLERDSETEKMISPCADFNKWKKYADKASNKIKIQTKEEVETIISDAKYGFIAGALQETFVAGTHDANKKTRLIDNIVTHKWFGFPIFIFLMWFMFMATFFFGAYPQEWIEVGIGKLNVFLSDSLSDGSFKDLLINGIVGGVGSVLVFLPNILILYLFISFMENSGYMARAAFIMDKLMHKMGLHGKSFIPLIMGFGCNVPAIMASRAIESRSSRLITILINPFMSCSARIPVFLLLAGAFFPAHAGNVLIFLYLFGIIVAVVTARLLRKTFFKADETPFVMELPPYRLPTGRATLKHTWDKGQQYLRKIGGIILVASIIIWFLSYYPRNITEYGQRESAQFEQSYLGRFGKFCEPALKPIGLDRQAGIALLSGIPAKEIIVSTLGVLHKSEEKDTLSAALSGSSNFTPRSALSFMVFILLYFPCIATIATIAHEAGRKWAFFSIAYNTALAWTAAFVVYYVGGLFL
jgi:ferrous iron transport protein B